MKDFKKALFSSLTFLFILAIVSLMIIEPYINSELNYYNDKKLRNDLSGSINYTVIGSSHALTSFIPSILDEKLECNSYNLSGSLMAWNGRSSMVNEEIERNPIQTMVLEVSYNSMVLPKKVTESNIYTYPRLNSVSNRLKFLVSSQSLSEFDLFYADLLNQGTTVWEGMLYRTYKSKEKDFTKIFSEPYNRDLNYDNKGFLERKYSNITLSKEEAINAYASEQLDTNFRNYNLQEMKKIISACKEKNIEVIIVIVPISDRFVWRHSGWDSFQENIHQLSKDYDCDLYDFNLLKNRYILFSDNTSFSDETHLCKEGAEVFSEIFCELMIRTETEDTESLFYPSYTAMISDSPYMQYMLETDY